MYKVATAGGAVAASAARNTCHVGALTAGIVATAGSGTAANAGLPSANPGQAITLTGSGFDATTDVVFPTFDSGGNAGERIVRPVAKLTQLSYYPQLAARARELADGGCTIAQIAGRLNAEGFRPPKRSPAFTPNAVSDLVTEAMQ